MYMPKTVLQQKRLQLGYSQSELASLSGINYRSLQDYEQGHKSLNLAKADIVLRLSKALNCDMEDLLVEPCKIDRVNQESRLKCVGTTLAPKEQMGSVDIIIDVLVPCLKNVSTGEEEETVVFKIESRSFLKQFKSTNGWHINWSKIPSDVDVYALALKSTNEIQGLIGIKDDKESDAVYIHWACTAPHNNVHECGSKQYSGVGGHLFAIAADISQKNGHEGYIYGYAANREVLNHYVEVFGAIHMPYNHIYQFLIDEDKARELLEVYNYEWNNS